MSPSRNDSATTASYVLILGSLLTIIPNIPVINEYLPIIRIDFLNVKGGITFLGSYYSAGSYQINFNGNGSWTLLGLDGQVVWLVFVVIGVAGLIIALILKTSSLIKLIGVVGGIMDLVLSVLIFLGDSQDPSKFGLSNLGNSGIFSIGLGFWMILIGSIVILASGLMVLKK